MRMDLDDFSLPGKEVSVTTLMLSRFETMKKRRPARGSEFELFQHRLHESQLETPSMVRYFYSQRTAPLALMLPSAVFQTGERSGC